MKNHSLMITFGSLGAVLLLGFGSASAAMRGSHDDAARASASSSYTVAQYRVEERGARQEGRIAEGVRSGELTPRETRRLVDQQRYVRQLQQRARADGVVTTAERREIQMEQNRANQMIRRMKNNDRRY